MTMPVNERQFYEKVTELLKEACLTCSYTHDEFSVTIEPDQILRCVTFLRDHGSCLFNQLIDITAVDYPSRKKRFDVVYHFLSLAFNKRLRLKCAIGDDETMQSITSVFQAADWYEREVFDLYGIAFVGHPDLRRILTDYSFEGHPLRKDFPLTGYVEVRYDELEKKVIYEPVSLSQAFRSFDYLSPWEGMLQGVKDNNPKPILEAKTGEGAQLSHGTEGAQQGGAI